MTLFAVKYLFLVVLVCSATIALAQPAMWLDVPFVAQPENGCGAAVVSMVMQYWNDRGAAVEPSGLDVDSIQHQLYSPADRGIKPSAMESYFTAHHFRTFNFRGDEPMLAHHLAEGRPLIVALRESRNVRHYVVVVGLDRERNLVLVNDPAQRKLLKMNHAEFSKKWAGTGFWTLLVIPQS